MPTKSEKKRKDDDKTKNKKSADPLTLEVDPNMHEPVRGLPKK